MNKKYIVFFLLLSLVFNCTFAYSISPKVVYIKIKNKKKITIEVGKKIKIKTRIKVKPSKAKYKKLCFESSNRKVATVSSKGIVKGCKKGSATIMVWAKYQKSKKVKIAVKIVNKSLKTKSSAQPTTAAPTTSSASVTTTPPVEATKDPLAPAWYNGQTLKDAYKKYFLMGAAINGAGNFSTMALNHDGMRKILKEEFNSTVLSNFMKPDYILDHSASKNSLKSADGMPVCKFDTCDPVLEFCRENGIKMRGHVLVWHNQVPQWFFFKDYEVHTGEDYEDYLCDKNTMSKRLESYIRQVITHCQDNYPGVIYCWDVVNECISTEKATVNCFVEVDGIDGDKWCLRTFTKKDNDFEHDGLLPNFYYKILGEKYVEESFQYARKYADKDVKLFYNDYNVFDVKKRGNIYNMCKYLKSKGIIDGIGLQPTISMTYPNKLDVDDEIYNSGSADKDNSFRRCLEVFGELGLEIQITELAISVSVSEKKPVPSLELQQNQAKRFGEFMKLLLKEDSDNGGPCNITSVTVFGICDDYPLYENNHQNQYLFDKNCKRKLCYYSFLEPAVAMNNY